MGRLFGNLSRCQDQIVRSNSCERSSSYSKQNPASVRCERSRSSRTSQSVSSCSLPSASHSSAPVQDISASAKLNQDGSISITMNANSASLFKIDTKDHGGLKTTPLHYSPIKGSERTTKMHYDGKSEVIINYDAAGNATITVTLNPEKVKEAVLDFGGYRFSIDTESVKNRAQEAGNKKVEEKNSEPLQGKVKSVAQYAETGLPQSKTPQSSVEDDMADEDSISSPSDRIQ